MRQRIAEELELLREAFKDAIHAHMGEDDWFLLPNFPVPEGWRIGEKAIESVDVAFKLTVAYPTTPPYGFVTSAGINFNGLTPGNPGSAVTPPFPGAWQHFSYAPEEWHPKARTREGANVLTWIRGIKARFAEGA